MSIIHRNTIVGAAHGDANDLNALDNHLKDNDETSLTLAMYRVSLNTPITADVHAKVERKIRKKENYAVICGEAPDSF